MMSLLLGWALSHPDHTQLITFEPRIYTYRQIAAIVTENGVHVSCDPRIQDRLALVSIPPSDGIKARKFILAALNLEISRTSESTAIMQLRISASRNEQQSLRSYIEQYDAALKAALSQLPDANNCANDQLILRNPVFEEAQRIVGSPLDHTNEELIAANFLVQIKQDGSVPRGLLDFARGHSILDILSKNSVVITTPNEVLNTQMDCPYGRAFVGDQMDKSYWLSDTNSTKRQPKLYAEGVCFNRQIGSILSWGTLFSTAPGVQLYSPLWQPNKLPLHNGEALTEQTEILAKTKSFLQTQIASTNIDVAADISMSSLLLNWSVATAVPVVAEVSAYRDTYVAPGGNSLQSRYMPRWILRGSIASNSYYFQPRSSSLNPNMLFWLGLERTSFGVLGRNLVGFLDTVQMPPFHKIEPLLERQSGETLTKGYFENVEDCLSNLSLVECESFSQTDCSMALHNVLQSAPFWRLFSQLPKELRTAVNDRLVMRESFQIHLPALSKKIQSRFREDLGRLYLSSTQHSSNGEFRYLGEELSQQVTSIDGTVYVLFDRDKTNLHAVFGVSWNYADPTDSMVRKVNALEGVPDLQNALTTVNSYMSHVWVSHP